MEINKAQHDAIIHKDGPAMILAGPGSGKTTVIVKRTEYLIRHHQIPPANILVITFTKAAAREMKERFQQVVEGNLPVWFGTFHAVFFSILKHAYHYTGANILKAEQKREIFQTLLYQKQLDMEEETDFFEKLEGEISKVKTEQIPLENYYPICTSVDVFRHFFCGYEAELRRRQLIDFDDMMLYCHELFLKRPDILAGWQQKFQYILVDEFQDINQLQYTLIKMLAKPQNHLFVVGDDDQSIYAFRGSKPEIMLNFEKDFPETKRILLDINYRSDENIVKLSQHLISYNKVRFLKKIRAFHEPWTRVSLVKFAGIRQENEEIINHILSYRDMGIPLEEMAVIFRTNTQPQALVGKLMEKNIPFYMKDKIPNIFHHWIARDIITYLRIARGSRQRKDFLRIMNRPLRYISRDSLESPEVDLEEVIDYYAGKRWMQERVEQLQYDLAFLQKLNPYAGIRFIRKGIEYDNYVKDYAAEHKVKEEDLFSVLEEVMESAREYNTVEEWFAYIDSYEQMLREQMEQNHAMANTEGVSLVTMHSSKGLEYRVVFIMDANEGITPYHKAVLDSDIEEERRLFYVAMTRAKEKLHIYSVEEYYNKNLGESRFVEEICKADRQHFRLIDKSHSEK